MDSIRLAFVHKMLQDWYGVKPPYDTMMVEFLLYCLASWEEEWRQKEIDQRDRELLLDTARALLKYHEEHGDNAFISAYGSLEMIPFCRNLVAATERKAENEHEENSP